MSTTLSPAKTRSALRTSAFVSLQVLVILLMTAVTLRIIGAMWSVVWPLVVALLLTTLTWPPTRCLRRKRCRAALVAAPWAGARAGWPRPRGGGRAVAASAGPRASLLAPAGVVTGVGVPGASQSGDLATGVVDGIQQAREWAAGPPLNIGDGQV